jgi:hypothetical protein
MDEAAPNESLPDVFYPLPPRLTMLLSVIFTQGGSDDLPILDFLPDEDAFLLQEKAEELLQLDAETRVALIVQETRRQIQFAGRAGLGSIEPSWLLAALKGEHPLTIGIVLAQVSANARSRILSQLPPAVRVRVPMKEDLEQTRPEMMRIVREKFESKFVTMPAPPNHPTNFYFREIALLDGRELVQLIGSLGVEELAAAFTTVGRRKLAELCHRLGHEAAEALIGAVKETELRDAMNMSEANGFLSRMLYGLKLDEARGITKEEAKERFQKELFQKAGLFRLAKAIRMERPEFVQRIAQRIPRTHGRLLRDYSYRLNETQDLDEVKLRRLQDLILLRVERLAARGKINPRFLKFTFCYWGDEEAQRDDESAEDGEA